MKLRSEIKSYSFEPTYENFEKVKASIREAGFGLDEYRTRDSIYNHVYSNLAQANMCIPEHEKDITRLGTINFAGSYGIVEVNMHKGVVARKLEALIAGLDL